MLNLLKVLQRAILYLIIFILPAPALFSQSISGARFDYNFPYAADSKEREALQQAYGNLTNAFMLEQGRESAARKNFSNEYRITFPRRSPSAAEKIASCQRSEVQKQILIERLKRSC